MESSDSSNEIKRESDSSSNEESYTDIMMKRWQKHMEKTLDQKDLSDTRTLNGDNG
jgi:hypothetical protein